MKKLSHLGMALAVLLAGTLSACVKDRSDATVPPDDGMRELRINVVVPGNLPGGTTRSISATEENTIQTVSVLAFKIDGANETFDYQVKATLASNSSANTASQTWVAMLQPQSYQQRFVVVTNAASLVGAQTATTSKGTAKATVLANLRYDYASNQDRWTANASYNYTQIPMWGESQPETVTATTRNLASTIYLMRMVARIDVQLNSSVTSQFKMKSVDLYNTNSGGRMTPDAANVTTEQRNGTTYLRATAPTIPTNLQPYSARRLGPINYTDFSSPGTTDVAMLGAIYTFEAAAATADNEATCIVVGGLYGSDTTPSYYKVEFYAAGTQNRLPILRNNQYVFNITGVQGRGYPSSAEAFAARAVNMTAQVSVWNQSGLDNIAFDGTYTLATDKYQITLFSNQYNGALANGNNVFKTTTTVPSGWSVASITDIVTGQPVTWLSVSPTQGAANQTTSVTVNADPNNTGSNRWAAITLKASRLTVQVLVAQTNAPAIALNIYNSSNVEIQQLEFPSSNGAAPATQTFRVDWLPATNPVSVNPVVQLGRYEFPNPGGNPAYGDGAPYLNMPWTEQTGSKTFTVSPPAIEAAALAADPFVTKSSRFDMTINNGFTTMTKSITLRQYNYALVVEGPASGANPFVSPYYAQLGGGTWNYNVRSNTNWQIKSITSSSRTGDALIDSSIAADNVKVGAGNSPTPPSSTPGGGYKEQFSTTKTRNGNSGYADVVYTPVVAGQFNDVTQRIYFPSKQFIIYSICLMNSGEARDYSYWSGNSTATGTPYTDHDMYTATLAGVNYGTALNTTTTPYTTSGGNASTVFTPPVYVAGTWASGSSTAITVAQIQAAANANADMLIISGDSTIPRTDATIGSDVAQAIWTYFLSKDKPVFLCIDNSDSVKSMFINLRNNGKVPAGYNMTSVDNVNGNAPVYWHTTFSGSEAILAGPFGNLYSAYWGADGSGTCTYWMTNTSGSIDNSYVSIYSDGNNQCGDTTGINGGSAGFTASNGMTCFRFNNAPLVVVSDGGFLASRDQGGTTTFPSRVNTTTKIPGIGGGYGGGSGTKRTVSNAIFTANVVAWAINRRTTQ